MTPTPGLVERLSRVRYVRDGRDDRDFECDTACEADDYGARAVPVNPDGADAIAAIEALQSRLSQAEADLAGAREALERLGWGAAFETPHLIGDGPDGRELKARMAFAREAASNLDRKGT